MTTEAIYRDERAYLVPSFSRCGKQLCTILAGYCANIWAEASVLWTYLEP